MPALLIDVRSAAEFAVDGGHRGAENLEYTRVAELASRPGVLRSDPITLYCRSGRRSGIALTELEGLGFTNVRDIGDFEAARRVLELEAMQEVVGNEDDAEEDRKAAVVEAAFVSAPAGGQQQLRPRDARKAQFEALLEGLERADELGAAEEDGTGVQTAR